MKAITVWQPWASLIAIGAKPYEFRKWSAPRGTRGRIAIHAGARRIMFDEIHDLLVQLRGADAGRSCLRPELAIPLLKRLAVDPDRAPRAHVVALATLGVPVRADQVLGEFGAVLNDSDRDGHFNFAWPLTEIEELRPPIPARGAQGFWEWTP
jgi:hypothetical protein